MAKIIVDPEMNLPAIAAAAGQSDIAKIFTKEGEFHVNDVSQEALDAALASAMSTASADALAKAKEVALTRVDENAGIARETLLTIAPGQEMTYLRKELDAEKFKADGYPEVDIADYPWIQAEASARDDTGQQVADLILAQAAAWTVIGVAIEEERIRGKVQIDQQMSVTGVENANEAAHNAINNAKNG